MTAASLILSLRLFHVRDREANGHFGNCDANTAMLYRRARLHAVPAGAAASSERPRRLGRLLQPVRA
jgi:hypothetical protein